MRTIDTASISRPPVIYSIQLFVKNCFKFLDYMQSNYEIIVADLDYKVVFKGGSLDGLSIEIFSVVDF